MEIPRSWCISGLSLSDLVVVQKRNKRARTVEPGKKTRVQHIRMSAGGVKTFQDQGSFQAKYITYLNE